jgi:hypothetical protein
VHTNGIGADLVVANSVNRPLLHHASIRRSGDGLDVRLFCCHCSDLCNGRLTSYGKVVQQERVMRQVAQKRAQRAVE